MPGAPRSPYFRSKDEPGVSHRKSGTIRLGPVVRLLALALPLPLLAASSMVAIAAESEGTYHTGSSAGVFLWQVILLMVFGRLLGEAMLRIGQPAVMGQLIAGILLGPSVLGALLPDLQHTIFPPGPRREGHDGRCRTTADPHAAVCLPAWKPTCPWSESYGGRHSAYR
jgi:hypothetical protein